jgi:hypothetical protein
MTQEQKRIPFGNDRRTEANAKQVLRIAQDDKVKATAKGLALSAAAQLRRTGRLL